MSCPECKPVTLGANKYPKDTLQDQPMVLEKNCAEGKSSAIYCLKDNQDGTAYIDSSIEGPLSAPFAIGYSAEISAIDDSSGYESVYVTTDEDNGRTYRIDSQHENTPLDKDAWKNITNIKVPYDIDTSHHDGCHGTDWFFQDDPVTIRALHGALFVGSYIVTPGLITESFGKNDYDIIGWAPKKINLLKGILDCALSNSSNPTEAIQIRSAIAMLETAEPTFFVSKGPYKFHYADIEMTVAGGDITILSERKGSDQSITDLNITIDPLGLFNDMTFRINRLGATFTYNGGYDYVTSVSIDSEKRALYSDLLKQALEQNISKADRETIEQVIGFINNPPPLPEWMDQP